MCWLRSFLALCLLAVGCCAITLGAALSRSTPAGADGPAPCLSGLPPQAFHGFCATYAGANTWFGSYGLGFPTPLGWGFCADPPAGGGDYPTTAYGYLPGGAPAGAGGDWNALGFAFSQAQAAGWWGGVPGQFDADQAAAAGKILFDTVVWGSPIPSMDPGVSAAYNDLGGVFAQALGTTGVPQLDVGLIGSGTTFSGSATDDIHVQFPGTGHPFQGLGVLLSITNGSFNAVGGPTFIGASTDANGNILVPIFANGAGTITVTVQSDTEVGQPGMGFWHPTTGDLRAQIMGAFAAPTNLVASQQLVSISQAPTHGTVSVQKSGDDTAYFPLGGAVFDIEQGGQVLAALTTDAGGATPLSPALPTGTYVIHEATAPPGYGVAQDQSAVVSANANTVVSFTGPNGDRISPATVSIKKVDGQSGAPLAGAVFDVRYDSGNHGVYDQDVGRCTTDPSGGCSPPGNDGASLLPGNYQVSELSAPPGYYLDPSTAVQSVTLVPGESGSVSFSDLVLGSISVHKTGDNSNYTAVTGAVFSLSGPAPSSAAQGNLVVGADGQSNTLGGLSPGTYTLTETTPPPGYQAVPAQQVAVSTGSAVTVVDVLDHVQPATLTMAKVDRETNAPLAGAILDVKYDPDNSGNFTQDLGTCSTTASGACAPATNDGVGGFLPGHYRVTEISAPPGYLLDPSSASQDLTLSPGTLGTVVFSDPLLVAASFQKVATGNVDSLHVIYAGAVIDVTQASPAGSPVATCTTDVAGRCATQPVLVSGTTYCWSEVSAPPGLQGGANGCFTAHNGQAASPITVSDAGRFVGVGAKKVDAANPDVALPGATFDLFRVDGGHGPDQPAPPSDVVAQTGKTWVARATTGTAGLAQFPLQFPGYAYCVVETTAPPNYVTSGTPNCTGVLAGTTTVPAPVVTLTMSDTEATVHLRAHKFNSQQPDTGIPGAVYDLYVQGTAPPSGVPTSPPPGVQSENGDVWFARGTTDSAGILDFTLPAGYAWCLREVSAPADYSLDLALHCTAVLTTESPASSTTVALAETPAAVHLNAHKFNSLQPDTVIAGATYELLAQGHPPADGSSSPSAGAAVPPGDSFWAVGTTDANGALSFTLPAGYGWCLHEMVVPAGYQMDPAFHCTAVLATDTAAAAMTVALPETPVPNRLAFTGGPSQWLLAAGLVLVFTGGALLLFGPRGPGARRARRGAASRTDAPPAR
jgi:hypothetical protein